MHRSSRARGEVVVEWVVLTAALAVGALAALGFISVVFAPMGQGIGDTVAPMFP